MFFRSALFHFQKCGDFPDTFLLLIYDLIPRGKKTDKQLCDFNPLKCTEAYFITKYTVCFGDYSLGIWRACVSSVLE